MHSFRAYLQFLRLPAVFTAMADILLGFLLNHPSLRPLCQFVPLLLASCCLYLSGMAFNDIFDRNIDAAQRPERPLPSGRIALLAAVLLAAALMLAGIGAAAAVGKQSLFIAAMLAACILAYNGLLKSTLAGPVLMGGCRFLNVMLGASAYPAAIAVWSRPQIPVAIALGIYIAGVTWFAKTEARRSSRLQLCGAAGLADAGQIALLAILCTYPWRGELDSWLIVSLWAAVFVIINARMVAAFVDPAPQKVQYAVATMLLSLVMLDAVVVLAQTGRPEYAGATAALVVPAMLLRRRMAMT